ncbi:hypothetical protein FRB99_004113 [Tulasnella sp. 403]|nr:hypothetical protein FRB99_004113 [Tulasnella sp. 403]
MLAVLRNTRPFRLLRSFGSLSAAKEEELADIVQKALPSAVKEDTTQEATTYTGPRLKYRPWTRHAWRSTPTSEYYSPNDFERSRRVIDTSVQRSQRPSGLGPSAARARRRDPFYNLGLNPLHEFRNAKLMSDFVTDMGMIKNRGATGLTRRNQRMLAKAIKRARNFGIIPQFSKAKLD